MAKKPKKKKSNDKLPVRTREEEHAAKVGKTVESATAQLKSNLISTKCTNCNLRLVIPEVESHRCVLCGCKELSKQPYIG